MIEPSSPIPVEFETVASFTARDRIVLLRVVLLLMEHIEADL